MNEPRSSFSYFEAIKYVEIRVSSVSDNAERSRLANQEVAKTLNVHAISNIKPQFNKGLMTSVTVTVRMAHTHLTRLFIFQFAEEQVVSLGKEVPNDAESVTVPCEHGDHASE